MGTEVLHLAGVIPVAGLPDNVLGMPWHDCLVPLAPDGALAIDRAVRECIIAG